MKNFTKILLSLVFVSQMYAQDGYTYTLIDNGSYSFSIGAVPNASTNNFAPSVQSYGFTIIVPDGVTITAGTSLGNAASDTFFDGSAIGQAAIDGYLVTETLGSPASLPAPSTATTTPVFTFTVNGAPTSGEMYILQNNSALANTITPLKSFMQADMIDDGSAIFTNVVDPNAAAVTAPSSFNFSVLSTSDFLIDGSAIKLHPNPTKNIAIIDTNQDIDEVQVYDLLGKLVVTTNNETIDLTNLKTGVYLVKIYANEQHVVKRLIKD